MPSVSQALGPKTSLESSRRAPRTEPLDLGVGAKSASSFQRHFAKLYDALVRAVRTFSHSFASAVCVRKVSQVDLNKPASNCKLLFWNNLGRLPNWQSTWL